MNQVPETIAAIATGPAPGAIGIVRLSGPQAGTIADNMFHQENGFPGYNQVANHTIHYGSCRSDDQVLDHILLLVMRAPNSYTGEDVAEFHCHGGPAAMAAILNTILSLGARIAGPGEFTRRAFLNDRLDLAQAEAVAAIIAARTRQALTLANAQYGGKLSRWLTHGKNIITSLQIDLTLDMDFTEDESRLELDNWRAQLNALHHQLLDVISRGKRNLKLLHGATVAITGPPNAGKSSLFNQLLSEERAIVTSQPGTTRDPVQGELELSGVPVRLTDTAGWCGESEPIAEAAELRRRQALAGATLVLVVFDSNTPPPGGIEHFFKELAKQPAVAILNKGDLPCAWTNDDITTYGIKNTISAKTGEGIPVLLQLLAEKMSSDEKEPEGPGAISIRQQDLLRRAEKELQQLLHNLQDKVEPECLLVDSKSLLQTLSEVSGETTSADIIDEIFSRFCIGK